MRGALVAALVMGCGQPPAAGVDGGAGSDGGGSDGGNPDGGPADGATDGPPISTCPSGQWCTEQAPIAGTTRLFAVHAVDPADVFAVGDGGTIVRRRQGAWSAMQSGTTEDLRGVWVAGSDDVWAVGENGAVRRWNGSTWSGVVPCPGCVTPPDFSGVWGASATDVWVLGTGRAYHWNGAAWTFMARTGALNDVSGTGPSDVWISAESGYLGHYTGSWTTVMPPGGGVSFFAVEARAANDVWASAAGGTVHFDGATWTQHATGAEVFMSIYAAAANDAWGVSQSRVGRWSGTSWTISTPPALTSSLWGIHGAGGHVWAVGSNATILHTH